MRRRRELFANEWHTKPLAAGIHTLSVSTIRHSPSGMSRREYECPAIQSDRPLSKQLVVRKCLPTIHHHVHSNVHYRRAGWKQSSTLDLNVGRFPPHTTMLLGSYVEFLQRTTDNGALMAPPNRD